MSQPSMMPSMMNDSLADLMGNNLNLSQPSAAPAMNGVDKAPTIEDLLGGLINGGGGTTAPPPAAINMNQPKGNYLLLQL